MVLNYLMRNTTNSPTPTPTTHADTSYIHLHPRTYVDTERAINQPTYQQTPAVPSVGRAAGAECSAPHEMPSSWPHEIWAHVSPSAADTCTRGTQHTRTYICLHTGNIPAMLYTVCRLKHMHSGSWRYNMPINSCRMGEGSESETSSHYA